MVLYRIVDLLGYIEFVYRRYCFLSLWIELYLLLFLWGNSFDFYFKGGDILFANKQKEWGWVVEMYETIIPVRLMRTTGKYFWWEKFLRLLKFSSLKIQIQPDFWNFFAIWSAVNHEMNYVIGQVMSYLILHGRFCEDIFLFLYLLGGGVLLCAFWEWWGENGWVVNR